MKKTIMFEEKEFYMKFNEFVDNFLINSKKGWGCHLVSNETDKKLDAHSVKATLYMIWYKTFDKE